MNPSPLRRVYRGGWSSSICDLFSDPTRRSAFCALACCGVLLSDRNRYVALQELPPPLCKRLLLYVVLPVVHTVIFTAMLYVLLGHYALYLVQCLVVAGLCARAQAQRTTVRRAIMRKMYAQNSSASVNQWLRVHAADTPSSAHATCWCFRNDILYVQEESESPSPPTATPTARPTADLCDWFWRLLSSLCCGFCLGSWFQCCGMCATGQEDRELQQLYPATKFYMDYITFQPYSEYMYKLQELRISQVHSLWQHVKNMSKLAYKLLGLLGIFFLVLALIALSDMDKHFRAENLLVVMATFFQAFFVLYFVHWRWNRFDLSLDAVVKFFSSGFVLCTAIAVLYEIFLAVVIAVGIYLLELIVVYAEMESLPQDDAAKEEFWRNFMRSNVWVVVLKVFFEAYLKAALLEELIKYFGFWMVEHPDMMEPEELVEDEDAEEAPEESSQVTNLTVRPLTSVGAGMTVAMVATALGFACCENLIYVFVYSPPSVGKEAGTLVRRSMFPVHPLCAAIQSIGVCRRDLEKDESRQLGRILLPAIFVHGTFDFILILLASLADLYDDGPDDESEQEQTTTPMVVLVSTLALLVVVGPVIVAALVYYVWQARAQRRRLAELERGRYGAVGDDNSGPL